MALRFWNTETSVKTTFAGNQLTPVLAGLADGGYVIAWEDDSEGTARIAFQRFDAGGTAVGTEQIVPISDGAGAQDHPSILALPGGGFAIGSRDFGAASDHDTALATSRPGSEPHRMDRHHRMHHPDLNPALRPPPRQQS